MLKSNSIGSALKGVVKDLHKPRTAYDYGFPGLTWDLTTGPGHVVYIGAKTGTGKTALGLQVAVAMAKSGRNVAYLSLEMTADQLAERLLARAATMAALRHRDATPMQEQEIRAEMDRLRSLPIDLVEASGATVTDIEQYVSQHPGVDVLVVDYVQLLGGKEATAYERSTNVSKALAALAHESGKMLLCLAQNCMKGDAANSTEPDLGAIQGTAQYEQDADAVLSLYREGKDADSRRILKITKNRHGPAGRKMYLEFDGNRMLFVESDDQEPRSTPTSQKFDFSKKKSGGEMKTVTPNPAYPNETIEVPVDTPEYIWRNMRARS